MIAAPTRVMGILNLTPDSFSDGGAYADAEAAVAAGLAMRDAGAAIVDVGAESTRPGAMAVDPALELARLLPVVGPLAAAGVTVSIDTRNAATMAACLDAGAAMINDVSALTWDAQSAPLLARRACPVILMHMRGTPADMHAHARYDDVVAEVAAELGRRRDAAQAAGIACGAIMLDPGIGFAKEAAHNFTLLGRLAELGALGCPLVVGTSRKRFLGADPGARIGGSIATAVLAAAAGAAIVRVHDVFETVQALAAATSVWTAAHAKLPGLPYATVQV